MADILDSIRIATPCSAKWEDMTGDERVRLCAQCALHVYNFENMTSTEVRELVTQTEGRVCGRFYRRADGRMVTSDCPIAYEKLKYRLGLAASMVVGVLTAAIGAIAVAAGADRTKFDLPSSPTVKKVCSWASTQPQYSPMAGGIMAMPVPMATPAATPALVQLKAKKLKARVSP